MSAVYYKIQGQMQDYKAPRIFELRVSVEDDNLWHYQRADKPEDPFVVFAKHLERPGTLSRTAAGYVWVRSAKG